MYVDELGDCDDIIFDGECDVGCGVVWISGRDVEVLELDDEFDGDHDVDSVGVGCSDGLWYMIPWMCVEVECE